MSETIYRGVTWRDSWTVTNRANGQPYDVTGATITFTGKNRFSDADRLVDLSVGNGITITGSLVEVEIDGAISAAWPAGIESIICAGVALVVGDTEPKVFLPPFRIPVRDMP